MNWTTIRLELARTPSHPAGSPSRAYLIRLPLDADGVVDQDVLDAQPRQATVRRFWPSEADRTGHVERSSAGWTLKCNGGCRGPIVATLEAQQLRLGEEVMIVEADGTRLPFRVAGIRHLS